MRLTCPNCEARYEIPDEVIPLDGRDVECSNCGRIWFQTHAGHPEAAAADGEDSTGAAESSAEPTHAEEVALAPGDETVAEAAEAEAEDSVDAAPAQASDTAIQALLAAPAEPAETEDEDEESAPSPSEPDDADTAGFEGASLSTAPFIPPVRKLDKSVIEILEQEAEREAQLRAAEAAAASEDEPDPELADAEQGTGSGVSRIDAAALSAEPFGTETVPVDAPDATARATDFDDDDTIEIDAGAMEPRPRRSGFALGFGLVALLAAILILTYANARVIAETVPQLDPALDNYVGMVNQGRVWLDTRVSMMLPK